jgi:hypothetical protein
MRGSGASGLVMQAAQKIDDYDNQEDRSETDAGASTVPPPAMAIIAAASSKQQEQNNN